MFPRHKADRYSTEPLHKIFKDTTEEDCFFKRISENETLFAKKLSTHNPEVWKITRNHNMTTGVLIKLVSGSEKQEFLDELFIKFKESISAAAFEYATPRLPAVLGRKIGLFLSPSNALALELVNKAAKNAANNCYDKPTFSQNFLENENHLNESIRFI